MWVHLGLVSFNSTKRNSILNFFVFLMNLERQKSTFKPLFSYLKVVWVRVGGLKEEMVQGNIYMISQLTISAVKSKCNQIKIQTQNVIMNNFKIQYLHNVQLVFKSFSLSSSAVIQWLSYYGGYSLSPSPSCILILMSNTAKFALQTAGSAHTSNEE